MSKAPPPITAYCSGCDARVSGGRSGAEHVQGPDGRIYCLECGEAMKLLEREHVPPGLPAAIETEETPGLPAPPVGRASTGRMRAVKPAPKPSGSSPLLDAVTPTEKGPGSKRWIALAIATAAIALGMAAYLFFAGQAGGADDAPPPRAPDPPSNRAPDPPGKEPVPPPANGATADPPRPRDPEVPGDPEDPEDPGPLSTTPPAPDLPPLDRLAAKWATASKNVDRARMRECVKEALAFDAAADADLGRRRDEFLRRARAGLFDAEWPWVLRQIGTLEQRESREAARAYLDEYLGKAAGVFDEEQMARMRAEQAKLAGE